MQSTNKTSQVVPLVAPETEVRQFIQRALHSWISGNPPEKIREQFPSAAHVDSLAAGLEKLGIETDEFKGRLWARMEGRKWVNPNRKTSSDVSAPTDSPSFKIEEVVTYKGKEVYFRRASQILPALLVRFQKDDNSFFERLYRSGKVSSHARNLIAKTPEDLYLKNEGLRNSSFIKELSDGWLLASNLGHKQIYEYIKIITEFAGLEFGRDVIVKIKMSPADELSYNFF